MNFIDFCSGIGGGRLGLEQNGFECLGFSEIDKSAIKTYESFFDTKNEFKFGNLKDIKPENLPKFDILISGFPCQSFSIVGKREGLENNKNGEIIFCLTEILRISKPKFFILENVKGILNHNKGQTLKIILNLLQDSGYKVDFKLLNSLDFGLAHSRERVYFVGTRKDLSLKSNPLNQNLPQKNYKLSDFLSPNKDYIFDENSQIFKKYLNNKYNSNRFNLDEILKENFLVVDTRQSDLRLYRDKIPTLRRDRQGILYVFNGKLYKLNPLEALNLQGFDKVANLKGKISNLKSSDILKQCGNAMSVNIVSFIARGIKEFYG